MLKQIRYFQAVVRLGSFSKAAEECYISQSAISQQIQALERELGVELLRRENRRFSLTPAGEYFYKKSLLLTADYDRLCRDTVRLARGQDAVLRVGRLRSYGGAEFQRSVAAFTTGYPTVSVEVRTGNHEELYELLRDGEIDLALNDQRRAFSDEYGNVILSTTACQIEVSAHSPIARLDRVNVDELANTPCILVASSSQRQTEQVHYREVYGIRSEMLFAEGLEEARLMVVGGQGFLPVDGGQRPEEYADLIVSLPLCRNGEPILVNTCAFWKKQNTNRFIEPFIALLKEQFEQE